MLAPKGAAGSWQNPDEQIVIPLQTARYRVFGTDRLRQITVEVRDGVPLQQGMVDIEGCCAGSTRSGRAPTTIS